MAVFTLPPCREKTQILNTVQTGSQTSNNLAPGKVCLWSHWSRKALGFRACALHFSSVHLFSCVQLFVILWTAAHQASLSVTNSRSLLKLMSIESVMPSNRLILCHLLLLPSSIFPSIGFFQMSQFFTSGGQSIGVSALTSVLPMNTQDLSPLGWSGWISLQSKGFSKVFSNTTVQKHQLFGAQLAL